jgi:hypothetical protein
VNQFYDTHRVRMLSGGFDWAAGTKRCVLVNSGYVFAATHLTLAEIVAGNRVGSIMSVSDREVTTDGWATSSAVQFLAVPGVTPITGIVLVDGATEAADLIAYFDDAEELPITPYGFNVFFRPNPTYPGTIVGTGGWFRP